jgi:hypothetical protein
MRSQVFTYRERLDPEALSDALDAVLGLSCADDATPAVVPGSSYLVMKPKDRQVLETKTLDDWIASCPEAIEGEAFLEARDFGLVRVYFRNADVAGPGLGFPLTSVAVCANRDDDVVAVQDILRNVGGVAALEDVPQRKDRPNGKLLSARAQNVPADGRDGRDGPISSTDWPMIFISHGGASPEWRHLEQYLMTLTVEPVAFESLSRPGLIVANVLEEVLNRAKLAFIVFTAEDETADGKKLARQNVVHEAGLFQARLGFDRAIILREEGVEEFSNVHGVLALKFRRDHIAEVFDDVLDLLQDAFPNIRSRDDE